MDEKLYQQARHWIQDYQVEGIERILKFNIREEMRTGFVCRPIHGVLHFIICTNQAYPEKKLSLSLKDRQGDTFLMPCIIIPNVDLGVISFVKVAEEYASKQNEDIDHAPTP